MKNNLNKTTLCIIADVPETQEGLLLLETLTTAVEAQTVTQAIPIKQPEEVPV